MLSRKPYNFLMFVACTMPRFLLHSDLIAVNNAGLGMGGVLESLPIDMVKELFEVNFFGALRLIKAVLPSMKARQSGHIINNSSHFGIVGAPFNELYSASKFALEGLSEGLAPVLAHFNIRYRHSYLPLSSRPAYLSREASLLAIGLLF